MVYESENLSPQSSASHGMHREESAGLLHRPEDGGAQLPGPERLCWNGKLQHLLLLFVSETDVSQHVHTEPAGISTCTPYLIS